MTNVHQETWRQKARCREVDGEAFFPVGAASPDYALRICARCPVRKPCLTFALDNGIQHGVYGGTTAAERKRMLEDAR